MGDGLERIEQTRLDPWGTVNQVLDESHIKLLGELIKMYEDCEEGM